MTFMNCQCYECEFLNLFASYLFSSVHLQNIYKEANKMGMAKGYKLPYDTPAIKHAKQTSLNCSDVSETISLSCSLSPAHSSETNNSLLKMNFFLCFYLIYTGEIQIGPRTNQGQELHPAP